MNAMSLKKMVVVFVLVGVLAGFVQADKLELQAKLSKEVKIQLKDVTIVEALEKIGEKAGLEIVLSDEAAWKLPQGAATRLSVMLQGPLAESLTEMLNAFFMRYAVGEERITIYPRPELEHILGRPTTKQLELLKEIYTKPITEYWVGEPQRAINEALGQEILILPIDLHGELNNRLSVLREKAKVKRKVDETVVEKVAHKTVTETVTREWYPLSAPLTVAQLLSRRDWAWYLSGVDFLNQIPEIRMVSSAAFRQARLDQIVDISMEGEAAVIIQRLVNWAGMELYWDKRGPDWPDGIIGVNMQNVKLGQALRNVISMVDGEYSINVGDNRIRIVGPIQEMKRPTPRATRTSRRPSGGGGKGGGKIVRAGGDYVGKISIPMDGGKYYIEFMLRESDLTEELRKLRDEKMEQILGRPPKPRPAAAPEPEPRKPAPAAKPAARRSR